MSNSTNSVNSNRNNIVKSNLEGYNTLYKIDLNFDSDITKMNNDVLSDYIVRVLGNHPYYVDVTNIVDLTNTIDYNVLKKYFTTVWQPITKKYKYSGLSIVDEVNNLKPLRVLE